MIKLTTQYGAPHWINPEHITDINHNGDNGSCVFRSSDVGMDCTGLIARETPEEVVQKVLEYKIAMMDYKVLYAQGESVFHIEEKLQRLAGLGHLINT